MPVKMMCIAPHGSVVIPELRYYQYAQPTLTTQALLQLRGIAEEKKIDHFIVIDPHADSSIKPGKISVVPAQAFRGTIGNQIDVNAITCVYYYNHNIQEKIESLEHANFINRHSLRPPEVAMSWGSYVPLYMIARHQTVTILTLDRKMSRNDIHSIVKQLYKKIDADEHNIGIIFSADLSHAWSKHYEQFPYHSNSKVYDEYVVDLIKSNSLESYREFDNVVDTASTCAHGPLSMLAEICKDVEYQSTLLSYEVPSYYGMAVALIEPINSK